MKTGLLFDLDGTLLDTLGDLTDATNFALRSFGYPERTLAEIRTFVGNGAENQIRLSLPSGASPAEVQQVLSVYKPYYTSHCQVKTAPYGGIPDALKSLAEFPMAIVSNKPDPAVKALCAQYFPGMYALGERAGCPRKPAPDMLRQAMQDLGVTRCIYIGDSEVDILTAKNAHVPCLCVTWGFREQSILESAGGSHFCADPYALSQSIRALLASM